MNAPAQQIEQLFIDHYTRLKEGEIPSFKIQFYPYANLNHTIRVRQGKVVVRISDILSDAPAEVVGAVLAILLYRLFRRSVPRQDRQLYQAYVSGESVRHRIRHVQATRGRKQLTPPAGHIFNLVHLYDELNAAYFQGQLRVRHLSWSRRRSRTVLGHYDAIHDAIVINRRLDHASVPRFVLEYVLYHEMLHAHLHDDSCVGRRRMHHRAFREAEQKFCRYAQAVEFISARYANS